MTNRNRLIALLISIVMIISLFTVCISAETETSTATDESISESTEAITSDSTEAESSASTEAGTSASTEASTSGSSTESDSSTSKGEIITNIVVLGIIVIVAVVLIIKFREKLAAFLRSVKSELKKIVWASGKDTRKSFLVVIVITLILAAVIGILDFAFSKGISGIVKLLQK